MSTWKPCLKGVYVGALAGGACIGSAVIWDYAADYDYTQNPAGAWSYGYQTSLGGALTLFDEHGDNGEFQYWMHNMWLNAPSSGLNVSGHMINGAANGEAVLHGGPHGEIATARWTAPMSGQAHVFGKFGQGDGGEIDALILLNDVPQYSHYSAGIDSFFDVFFSVNVGDRVDFGVGTAGSFFFDTTPLYATIEIVPEPSALAALALGVLALLRRNR